MLDQKDEYGLSWLTPTRQVPSGAKRASGMLTSPVCPVTLGSCAQTGALHSARKASAPRRRKSKAPARGLFFILGKPALSASSSRSPCRHLPRLPVFPARHCASEAPATAESGT